ncbi:MAG: Rrf2 family transcriptional regulator [Candidatus Cloacimonetes bacterium]|nr:Rrf2 family transcriptional regulator [Candidatus Cloacimonadota bacterium]MCF7812947.1 Rrf2 family transcriptional regulator [Candidatus Cloacimonadota bacterium]MCF7867158.1 Rrf2 family transcriptional regulator [Candidatus Cloacimonadota bacterium]MCF7882522.1 Rrf2 family transcriptional regulator [Candidatus Cloacimonadota bacterium]
MHISTKTEYAVRALSELAISSGKDPVSISHICENQKLPRKYVEQLFRKLKKSELVSSKHGAMGGYILNKPIRDISLQDIMEAVDESYVKTFCTEENHKPHCIGWPCGFHQLWDEIKEHLDSYFDSIKLDQIIAKL